VELPARRLLVMTAFVMMSLVMMMAGVIVSVLVHERLSLVVEAKRRLRFVNPGKVQAAEGAYPKGASAPSLALNPPKSPAVSRMLLIL